MAGARDPPAEPHRAGAVAAAFELLGPPVEVRTGGPVDDLADGPLVEHGRGHRHPDREVQDECMRSGRPRRESRDQQEPLAAEPDTPQCPVCRHRWSDHPGTPDVAFCVACMWEEDHDLRTVEDMCRRGSLAV